MIFEESAKGPATVLIVQREAEGAQELENALVSSNPGTICIRAKTVQGAVNILSTIKPGQLKMMVIDTSIDLEQRRQRWSAESLQYLRIILKTGILDSGSILLLMAGFFHPNLEIIQRGLLAHPVRIISTSGATRANEQMSHTARTLPGTVFEIQRAA